MPDMDIPGITTGDLLNNFRKYSNNPNATADDMVAQINAQVARARVSVPLTAGKGTWVYPRAFPAGVVPVVTLDVETPDATSYLYDAKIIEGSATSTKVDFIVNRFNASQTLGGTLTAVLNTVIAIFAPLAGPVSVNINATAATATS